MTVITCCGKWFSSFKTLFCSSSIRSISIFLSWCVQRNNHDDDSCNMIACLVKLVFCDDKRILCFLPYRWTYFKTLLPESSPYFIQSFHSLSLSLLSFFFNNVHDVMWYLFKLHFLSGNKVQIKPKGKCYFLHKYSFWMQNCFF